MYTSVAPSRSNQEQVNQHRTECIYSYRYFLSLVSLPTAYFNSLYACSPHTAHPLHVEIYFSISVAAPPLSSSLCNNNSARRRYRHEASEQ